MVVLLLSCRPPAPAPVAAPELRLDDEALVFYLSGRLALADGDTAEAGRSADWMVRLGGDPWTLIHASELWLEAGSPDRATALARSAVAAAPELPEAHRALGFALRPTDPAGAFAELESARGTPGVAQARAELAVAAGDPSVADRELAAWTPVGPVETLAHARVSASLARHDAAVEAALRVAADPAVGGEALRFAVAEARQRCDLRPIHAWLRSHPSLEGRPGALEAMTLAAEAVGDPVLTARLVARQGEARASPEPDPLVVEGDRWLAEGRADEVLAATEGHTEPHVAWVRAAALTVVGRVDEAVALVRSTASSPLDAELREAKVRELAGEPALAHAAATRAAALDPCSTEALELAARHAPSSCAAAELWARLALARPADPGPETERARTAAACGAPGPG